MYSQGEVVVYLFIVASLGLSILLHGASPWLVSLTNPAFCYAGLGVAGLCLLTVMVKKNPPSLSFDVFAVASLLVWFSRWQPLFKDDTPVFFFFSLYFLFVVAFIELALINQQTRVDEPTLSAMRAFARDSRVRPWLVMVVVLGSLGLEEHYLLYPIAMTVLLIRVAMHRYLGETQNCR